MEQNSNLLSSNPTEMTSEELKITRKPTFPWNNQRMRSKGHERMLITANYSCANEARVRESEEVQRKKAE